LTPALALQLELLGSPPDSVGRFTMREGPSLPIVGHAPVLVGARTKEGLGIADRIESMSYLVLARKYRPRNFTELVGQEHVVQALSNALVQQRLHHAYLFTGTRGVGKTTVSRILAKSLNCQGADGQGGITAEPCGVCQACRDIDSGRFVDYTELDAASNRGVDEVQSLLEQAVYKPVQGRFKVFMIDEVHMLTNTAFNAMLKTLEEPPEYLKFVLATTDPQKVPVTVLSRCLQFNLRPMAPETVFEHLTRVLAQENLPAEPLALRMLARAARGSMRDALSLTDQAIAFGNGQLQEVTVRQMLGSVDRGHVLRLIDALDRSDGAEIVSLIDALRRYGLSAASALEDMSLVLQRMAVIQAVPNTVEDESDPDSAQITRLAKGMAADETQLLYSLCLHGRGELGLAPDEYVALTMILLRLLAFKPGAMTHTPAEKKSPRTPPLLTPEPLGEPHPAPAVLPVIAPVLPRLVASQTSVQIETASEGPPPWDDLDEEDPYVAKLSDDSETQIPPFQVLKVRESSEPTERTSHRRETAKPQDGAELILTPEGDFWSALVRDMVDRELINALVRELALQSQLIARNSDRWHLKLERESLNQVTSRERLKAALATLGHAVELDFEFGKVTDSPLLRHTVALKEKQWAAQTLIENDPMVQDLVRDFGAKIVPGSVKPI
jgi:DNA polymerase-3 subunit gamma/tau